MKLIVVTGLAACASEQLGETGQYDARTCAICGQNSPVIDSYKFHELSLVGAWNAEGFRIAGFDKNGDPYTPEVTNGKLRGIPKTAGLPDLEGGSLQFAKLHLQHLPSGHSYDIQIHAVSNIPYWTAGATATVETYDLRWGHAGMGIDPNAPAVCPDPFVPERNRLDMLPFFAVMFEGDRIDAKRIEDSGVDRTWFNIGCGGHALSKLALTAHTHAARGDGYDTELDDRTAMLKMLTADYCGNGTPFTVSGQPLSYKDSDGLLQYAILPPSIELEARWTAKGALCLNEPRLDANVPAPPLDPSPFVDLEHAIARTCHRPPACVDTALDHFETAHVISANPK